MLFSAWWLFAFRVQDGDRLHLVLAVLWPVVAVVAWLPLANLTKRGFWVLRLGLRGAVPWTRVIEVLEPGIWTKQISLRLADGRTIRLIGVDTALASSVQRLAERRPGERSS